MKQKFFIAAPLGATAVFAALDADWPGCGTGFPARWRATAKIGNAFKAPPFGGM